MIKNLITPADAKVLSGAILAELSASSMYKHLANQCQRLGLFGAAKFFLHESEDELSHYQRLADFANERGSVAAIPSIPSPSATVKSLNDALQAAYDIEVDLGAKYEKWYGQVAPTTQQFLLQYLEIQRKSIGEYADLLSRVSLCNGDECAVLLIDQEMGSNV